MDIKSCSTGKVSQVIDTLVETTKLSDKGQIVIPKDFRDKMGLKPGNKFIVIATEDAIILQRIDYVERKMDVSSIISKAKEITENLSLVEKK